MIKPSALSNGCTFPLPNEGRVGGLTSVLEDSMLGKYSAYIFLVPPRHHVNSLFEWQMH